MWLWSYEVCVYFSRSLWQQNCVWDTGHWLAVTPNLPQRNAEENSSEHTGWILPERVCCPSLSLLRLHHYTFWRPGLKVTWPVSLRKLHPLCPSLLWQVMFRLTGHNSGIIHILLFIKWIKYACHYPMFYDHQRLFHCPPLLCYTCLCG